MAGVGATLILLFDGMAPGQIAAALHTALGDRYYGIVHNIGDLNGDQWVVLAAPDVLSDFDDGEEEYVGTRADLNKLVVEQQLSDGIFETLRQHRDDIGDELRKRGLVKLKEGVDAQD